MNTLHQRCLCSGIESALDMEFALNLGWAVLAVFLIWKWLRSGSRSQLGCGAQLVALGMLLLILFPVISVTDDLQATHNPPEVERSLRRDRVAANSALLHPSPSKLPTLAFAGIILTVVHQAAPARLRPYALPIPARFAVQNRPPPCA